MTPAGFSTSPCLSRWTMVVSDIARPAYLASAGSQALSAAAAASAAAGRASAMRASASSSCAAETNHASYGDGGRYTPRSSMAWKNAA